MSLPLTVAFYTFAPWDHVLAVLRLVGPAQQTGIVLLRGNEETDFSLAPVTRADLVVVQRDFPVFVEGYEQVLRKARVMGKPVILEIEDLLLALPERHPDQEKQEAYLLHITRALKEVDAVTTSTVELCNYLRHFNPHTYLLPNYLVDHTWKLRPLARTPKQIFPVTIGYMGGNSHLVDLALVQPALAGILNRYRDHVRLKFWGQRPVPDLQDHPLVDWIPLNLKSYAEFAAYFMEQECDIAIAPLVDCPFNRCKSAIKYLEYSALGVPGVYSAIAPYEKMIRHGENGFLAGSMEEWEQFLTALIDSSALRRKVGHNAQMKASEYMLSQHAHTWTQTYLEILASKADC